MPPKRKFCEGGHAFVVLLWKHYIVRKRHFLQTLVEIMAPLSLMIALFYLKDRIMEKADSMPESTEFRAPIIRYGGYPEHRKHGPAWILYSPDSEAARELMRTVGSRMNNTQTTGVIFKAVTDERHYENVTAIVVFENMTGEVLPDKLNYSIMMRSLAPIVPKVKPARLYELFANAPDSFLRLQWAIDSSYLTLRSNSSDSIPEDVKIKPLQQEMDMITPPDKRYLNTIFFTMTYFSFLAPLLPFVFLMNRLLEERATGIQELVKMVGVTSTQLRITHFLNSLPPCLIYCTVATALLKATDKPMIPGSDSSTLFVALFLHFVTMLAMAFPSSYIVRNAQHTVSLSTFVYIGMWVPIRLLGAEGHSYPQLFALGFLPHAPTYWFINEASAMEIHLELGIRWRGIGERHSLYPNGGRNGSPIFSYFMQLVQIIMFFMISCYLENVRPGKYGIALPWYYCFLNFRKRREIPVGESAVPYDPEYQKFFEEPPTNLESGIKIAHVSKIFTSGLQNKPFQALNNVTLNIYKGEITVLLGHNGAGKSTLMSIITGMIKPTSGKVYVNGLDTVTEQTEVRKHLGLCPQHNLFFPDLTVQEHIMFFSVIKGGSFIEAHKSTKALMSQLNLTDYARMRTSTLSGGMLRRLQLGCALCGNASVLILDEPTSGLDVEARRELWDMLLALRGDRTLLLATHFMEEADVLGDRLAALHGGKLRCHATPMFLKRAIGSGFRLAITTFKQPDEENLTRFIRQTVPTAVLKEKSMNTLVYNLPPGTDLPAMFRSMESSKAELDVESLRIGITTLEEVFLELCCDVDTEEKEEEATESGPAQYKYITGFENTYRQIIELFKRQLDYTYSKIITFVILQVFMPYVLTCTLTKLFNNEEVTQGNIITLNLDMYTNPTRREAPAQRYAAYSIKRNSTRRSNVIAAMDSIFPYYNLDRYDSWMDDNSTKGMQKYTVAVNLDDTHAKVYHSTLRNSASVGINLLSNMLAVQKLNNASVNTINTHLTDYWPFESEKYHIPKSQINCALFAIFNLCTLMATAINDVSLPCKERLSVARHTHIMAGCPPVLYWLTTFLYHMACWICFCCVALVVAAKYFDKDSTISDDSTLIAIFVAVLLGGMNFYSFSYFVSFYLNERASSILLVGLMIIFGFLCPILLMSLEDLKKVKDEEPLVVRVINFIGMAVPTYLMTQSVIQLTDASRFNSYCTRNIEKCPLYRSIMMVKGFDKEIENECCSKGKADYGPFDHYAFSKHGCGSCLVIILVEFFVFMVLVLLLEYRIFNRLWNYIGWFHNLPEKRFNCPDVAAEKEYVNKTIELPKNEIQDTMLLNNVWKTYRGLCGRTTFALRDVNFSIKKGECFGVLGVNGAGKTTTFKVISGEEAVKRGDICVNGHLFGSDKYLLSLGYCPQFFGLDDFRSAANNLRLLLILRGLSNADVKTLTASWLEVVGMTSAAHREVSKYSGGMVRRVATAGSLCGNAPLTLLDEPTAGVDTAARRLVWAALKRGLMHDRAIVISSQSMDEMEKLCQRVTILSSGEMAVLGTPRALKAKYAAGHDVILKLKSEAAQSSVRARRVFDLKEALEKTFDCTLKDEHLTSLFYRVNQQMLYSDLFTKIEELSNQHSDLVEDYSVSDTTLEDVFLTFAHGAGPQPKRQSASTSANS